MKRFWFLLLALSLGLNAGLLYVQLSGDRPAAEPPRGPRHHGAGHDRFDDLAKNHVKRMIEGLDLNEDQAQRLEEVHRDLLPRLASASRESERLRRAVGDQYRSNNMEPERLRETVRRLNQAQAHLDSLVVEAVLAEAAILTPDQRERYARAMPWSRGGPPPPPPHKPR